MFYYGKLNDANTITEIVQSEARINDGEHVFLSAEDNFTGESYIGRKWARPSVPWRTISPRQGMEQLIRSGLDEQVDAAIDGITDPVEKKLTRNWIDRSTEWERDNAQLLSLAQALGLSDTDVDELFKAAAKL